MSTTKNTQIFHFSSKMVDLLDTYVENHLSRYWLYEFFNLLFIFQAFTKANVLIKE